MCSFDFFLLFFITVAACVVTLIFFSIELLLMGLSLVVSLVTLKPDVLHGYAFLVPFSGVPCDGPASFQKNALLWTSLINLLKIPNTLL